MSAQPLRSALIFAAGRGERMRPLTDHTPKPLLLLRGRRLIEYHLEGLAAAGVERVVINTSYLAGQFEECLGDGSRWGLQIHYSYEGTHALETGGGMLHALTLLCDPFIAVNGDIFSDFDFARLPPDPRGVAHLVMVNNPAHNAAGDFSLRNGLLYNELNDRLTFSGIGVYRHALLCNRTPGRFPLAPILRTAMMQGIVAGEHYAGAWTDIGTPTRLAELETILS